MENTMGKQDDNSEEEFNDRTKNLQNKRDDFEVYIKTMLKTLFFNVMIK